MASGKTTSAASKPWAAPDTIFSAATAHTGSGAITLSSISLVNPNSWTRGRATAWTPWNTIVVATTPAISSVEKAAWACDEPPMPSPIFGNTYVNTNTSNSGCMMVRTANWPKFLRSTWRSRRSRARNAVNEAWVEGRS